MSKEILFRCSSLGNLMVEAQEAKITEVQLKKIDQLLYEMEFGLNENGNKVKWTPNKAEELQKLIDKRDAPPQLSATAKKEVEKVWLLNEKGFYKELDNKFILKGLFTEEDGIELISDLDGEFYVKNDERVIQGFLSGECDIKFTHKDGRKIIKDIKACYDAQTFMNAVMDGIYEWQGRGYLKIYDYDEFHLEFTLNDLPPHLLESEIWKVRNRYGITDPDTPEAQPLMDQIRRNFVYSENPAYTKEERRKTFIIYRDKELEKKIDEKLELGAQYYKTITLNQIK